MLLPFKAIPEFTCLIILTKLMHIKKKSCSYTMQYYNAYEVKIMIVPELDCILFQ